MAILNRVRVALTGFPGGPGVATFVCNDVPTFYLKLNTFVTAMAVVMPQNVTLKLEDTGDVFESTTGEIMGTWTGSVLAAHVGGSTAAYSAPVGFVTEWLTDIHLSGRRLRGRTFWVPASSSMFSLDGSLDEGVKGTLSAGAATFVADTAGNFTIWQRPRLAKPADGSRPAVTARGGGYGTVTGSRIPDRAAVLRSRRD